jgi:hypothetical protein
MGVSVCRMVSNAPRKHDRLVKFVDHGRLANARKSPLPARAPTCHELRHGQSFERHDERDRDAEELRRFHWSPEKSVERLAAGIFEHQHGSIAFAH